MINGLKILWLLALGVLLIGFGLCGAVGVTVGVVTLPNGGASNIVVFILPGLVGLLIAWNLRRRIVNVYRSLKTRPNSNP